MPSRRCALARIRIIPRNERFYDLFDQSADNLMAASERLVDLFDNFDNTREKARAIKKLERDGDEITHKIMENLHRSFVTPIDREDIALLTNSMDDMLDYMEGAVKRLFLYHIDQPTPRATEITYIIHKVAIELTKAVPLLRHPRKLKEILRHCVEIHRLENEADDLQHAAVADLFEEETDVKEIIKWRDIYDNLEHSVDRGEDVANVLEGIVLKYA
jgi:predicted phosphate transport protein (TIGR00153 family)